jgi:glyoxylase-like metal-dependent hydrolase (beta-lactamase superfamily II)
MLFRRITSEGLAHHSYFIADDGLGRLKIRAISTPGHTDEGMSFALSDAPRATGHMFDTVSVGSPRMP